MMGFRWNQLRDHGTSHLCVVDGDRNAVAMTTTVNYVFGALVLSPSTGIVLNNEMDDFSVPEERAPDELPPAPANFIAPGKRPLSSMTPLIILKARTRVCRVRLQLFIHGRGFVFTDGGGVPAGRPARRRGRGQRRHRHHRNGDPSLPEPLHRRDGPSRGRPAPQDIPQGN